MEQKTLLLEDLNGHSVKRLMIDIISSLRETGGVVAFRKILRSDIGEKLQATVQCVYHADGNAFTLKIKDGDEWEAKAMYSQGREELTALDFIREVFEAEGRETH